MEKHPRKQATSKLSPVRVAQCALLLLALLLVLFFCFLLYQGKSQGGKPLDHLVLNEVLPDSSFLSNSTQDSQGSSWVELYNPTNQDISLAGWTLTNKKTELNRYAFPEDAVVSAHDFFVLELDPNATQNDTSAPISENSAGDESMDEADLSVQDSSAMSIAYSDTVTAPLRVTRGSTVCLSYQGSVIDSMELPQAMQAGTAYGRIRDGSSQTALLTTTKHDSNTTAEAVALVAQPVFSQASGFYDSSFELTIDAPENCTVYYTLDSSAPTVNSLVYEGAITITDPTPNDPLYSTNPYFGALSKTPVDERNAVYEGLYPAYIMPQTTIDKCAVVRAIAVDAQGNTSEITTASYFIGYDGRDGYDNLSVLSLVSDPDNLFGAERGIMVVGAEYLRQISAGTITASTYWARLKTICNYFQSSSDWERATHVDYFDSTQSLVFSQEAGLKMHGNTSRRQYQKGFSLRARGRYDGNDLFQGSFFDNGLLTDRISLVNGVAPQRYLLIAQMDNGRTMETQDYKMVQVFIDGEYWGFYAMQEPYNSSTYLSDHYGVSSNDVIMLATGNTDLSVVEGDEDAVSRYYQPLVNFAQQNDLSDADKYAELCSMMDVQSFIDYYATNLYVCNQDTNWHQNIYLFRTKEVSTSNPYADGRWHWMLYDMDFSSGTTSRAPVTLNSFTQARLNSKYTLDNDPLFSELMANEQFRQQFVTTFMDIANTVYGEDEMTAVLDTCDSLYRAAAYQSVLRYPNKEDVRDDETKLSRFNGYIDEMKDFFSRRFEIIVPAMVDYFDLSGKLKRVTVENATPQGGAVQLNTLTVGDKPLSGKYYTSVPVTLTAIPNEGWVFAGWEVSSGKLADASSEQTTLSFKHRTTVTARFAPAKATDLVSVSEN